MSLIGTLEQISLSSLLYRLESYAKNGLLIIQQGSQWVELYFRDGRLMCIGPVRTNATLGARLLQGGLISAQALQETLLVLGGAEPSETRMALTMMDRGYITHEQLLDWATRKAYEVLQVLLSWTSGELHFEENFAPPADRLLVAIAVSTLLAVLTTGPVQRPGTPDVFTPPPTGARQPTQSEPLLPLSEPLQPRLTRASEIPNVPTLMDASQFGIETPHVSAHHYSFPEPQKPNFPASVPVPPPDAMFTAPASPASPPEPSAPASNSGYISVFEGPFEASSGVSFGQGGADTNDDRAFVSFLEDDSASDGAFGATNGRRQPEPVLNPQPPRRIDISFMRPEMILLPVDYTPGLAQNPSVQITPDQWMVFVRVDGQTSLQQVCMSLGSQPSQVCQVVGELLAEGLIQISMPDALSAREFSPTTYETAGNGSTNGYITPGYASMPVPPWPSAVSGTESHSGYNGRSFEAQAQWGNGGNGANFTPGQGWVASSQPGGTAPSYPANMYAMGGSY